MPHHDGPACAIDPTEWTAFRSAAVWGLQAGQFQLGIQHLKSACTTATEIGLADAHQFFKNKPLLLQQCPLLLGLMLAQPELCDFLFKLSPPQQTLHRITVSHLLQALLLNLQTVAPGELLR